MPTTKAGPRPRRKKPAITLDSLARAFDRRARREGPLALLKMARPDTLRPGEVLVLIARENELLAVPLTLPVPETAVALPEAERRMLERGGRKKGDMVEATARAYGELLASSLTANQAAKILGTTPGRVRQRLGGPRPTLYGFKVGSEWFLPRFQFTDRGLVPGIDRVIAVFDPELHPLEVSRWLGFPEPDLEIGESDEPLSPLDWLRSGRPPKTVADLAKWL